MPTLEDFAESPATGELFIAYVEICRTLGDLVQGCLRKRLTPSDRSGVEAALFRWTRMLPLHLCRIWPASSSCLDLDL